METVEFIRKMDEYEAILDRKYSEGKLNPQKYGRLLRKLHEWYTIALERAED